MIVPRTSTPARQRQRSPSTPALRTCVLGALLLLAAGRPAAAQLGRFGFNIVRMEGVIGKGDPTRMIDVVLLVGSAEIPFAVTAVRRVSPNPEEGVGVLLPLGPGTPRIRVVGEAAFVEPLAASPAITGVVLLGNLNTGQRFLELLGCSLPPAPPVNGASAPRG